MVALEIALMAGGSTAANFVLEKFDPLGQAQHVDLLVREKHQQAAYHSSHRRLVETQDETRPASVTLSPGLVAVYGPENRDMGVVVRPAPNSDCRGDTGPIELGLSLQH
ncbi:hypothetical protein ACLOAV_003547 [Pseudogymnoascus australis]